MSEKYSLPNGWRWVKLGEVCEKPQYGYTASAEYSAIGPKFLRITDIQNGNVNWDQIPYCRCEQIDKYLLKRGDILFARTGGTTGKSYLISKIPTKTVFASYLIKVRVRDNLIPEFLYQFLQTDLYWEQVEANKRGGAQPNMNATLLSGVALPLPPLLDQRRIATKIQDLMQEVERAKESCEKQFEAAKVLPFAYLRQVFESDEAKKWERKRLGEVCELKNGYAFKSNDFIDVGVPVIRISDIQDNLVTTSQSVKVSKDNLNSYREFLIKNGDILIAMSGATTGKVGIYSDKIDALQNQRVGKFGPNSKLILNDFLWFIVLGISQNILDQAYGSAQPNISSSEIENFEISIPSLSEQNRIAKELKEKMFQVQNLQSTIRNQQSTIDALPQAILRKAFRGDLNV